MMLGITFRGGDPLRPDTRQLQIEIPSDANGMERRSIFGLLSRVDLSNQPRGLATCVRSDATRRSWTSPRPFLDSDQLFYVRR
jgi:hypothetical protein